MAAVALAAATGGTGAFYGYLVASLRFTGAAQGVASTTTPPLGIPRALAAPAATGTSTTAPAPRLGAGRPLDGATGGTSTTPTANALVTRGLASDSADGWSTVTATTIVAVRAFRSTDAVSGSAIVGALAIARSLLAPTVVCSSSTTAGLTILRAFASDAADGLSGTSAAMLGTKPLAGGTQGIAATAAYMRALLRLAGAAQGVGSFRELQVMPGGTSSGLSGTTAYLATPVALRGSSTGTSTVTGRQGVPVALSGTSTGVSTTTSLTIKRIIGFAGRADGDGETGTLTVVRALGLRGLTTATGIAATTASLGVAKSLVAASGIGLSTAAAVALVDGWATASAPSTSTGTSGTLANLRLAKSLAGRSDGVAGTPLAHASGRIPMGPATSDGVGYALGRISKATIDINGNVVTDRDWRAFTLRRTVGGDVVRADESVLGPDGNPYVRWHGALRWGAKSYPDSIVDGTKIFGSPIGYDTTVMTAHIPAALPWMEAVMVRGAFGYPSTPLDGTVTWYEENNVLQAQVDQQSFDGPLTQGRWYYYTLFLKIGTQQPGQWKIGATHAILVPKNYFHAEKLFNMLPPYYQSVDNQQAADGREGPLRRWLRIIGYDADYNRTLLDGVLNVYHPDFSPLQFIEQVGANMGLPIEEGLGGARYRSLVGRMWDLDSTRGTRGGLQDFVYAASNYTSIVVNGNNALLAVDDSEFYQDKGHWIPFRDPLGLQLHDVVNTIPGYPLNGPYANVTVTKSTDPTITPKVGRGVLKVTDTGNTYTDLLIVNGDTVGTGPAYYGIPVKTGEVWEIQFWHRRVSGPVATVIGSFAFTAMNLTTKYMIDGPLVTGVDTTAWQFYSYQITLTDNGYIMPTIWWHAPTAIGSRYVSGLQVARVIGLGGQIVPVPPDIFLTLGVETKKIGSPPDVMQSTLGTPS